MHSKYSLDHYLSELELTLQGMGLKIDADKVFELKSKASPAATVMMSGRRPAATIQDPIAEPHIAPQGRPEGYRRDRERFFSDKILGRNGIKSKEYIGGRESEKRGVGKSSKEGDIHKINYNGKDAVAKVLIGNAEALVWEKIYNLDMPKSISRHIPVIYKIIKDGPYSIIIMEELEPLTLHIRDALTSREGRYDEELIKSEDYIHEALRMSIGQLCAEGCSAKIKGELDAQPDYYVNKISGGIANDLFAIDYAYDYLYKIVSDSSSVIYGDFSEEDKEELASLLSSALRRVFALPKNPIPKYHDPDRLNRLKEHSPRSLWRKIDRDLRKVYINDPVKFLFSEKYMPETKSLFDALKFLKENGIIWDDVHTGNLMQRPSTRDVVIIDVGLYSIK